MIKRFREFIREFVEQNLDYISARMQELQDEISNLSDVESGSSLMYNWSKGNDEHLVINFTIDDIPYRYELDLKKDTPFIVKEYIDNQLSFEEEVSDEEDGLFLIEKKIRDVLGLYEEIDYSIFERKGRAKSQRYKGHKIPGKYLTKNPGAMKKEIDTYRGKKEYKKDWDADYKSGKGGKGKRVKTKKSASTLAYERMFKNKEK